MVYFNVFQCIGKCLNVFINIVIGVSPSYFHCNVFAMCTHVHIHFSLSTMTTFLTCYTTTLFFSIPINLFQLLYNLWKNYISIFTFHIYIIPHILHSMSSLVVRSIAQPKLCFLHFKSKILWSRRNLHFGTTTYASHLRCPFPIFTFLFWFIRIPCFNISFCFLAMIQKLLEDPTCIRIIL
jgi:hypothetical protein